jgi:hypothetical protein
VTQSVKGGSRGVQVEGNSLVNQGHGLQVGSKALQGGPSV